MAKQTVKPLAGEPFQGRMIFIVQPGSYAGQKLILPTNHADAAIADGWGIELGAALAPNDSPPLAEGEAPQSYLDFLADVADPGPPEPPPELIAPTLTALTPSTAEVGGTDIVMVATGTGFTAASVIVFNGGDEPTDFLSDTEVSTTVKPSLASGPGAVPVTVRDAGGASAALDFTFTEAA